MNEHTSKVIDAEYEVMPPAIGGIPPESDLRWGEWAGNVARIFADEPKPLDFVKSEAKRLHGYGEHLVRNCLVWLDDHGYARARTREGVIYWGKPIDVRKLVEVTAGVVDACAGPVEALGGPEAANVMRSAAVAARASTAAVEGIKRESAPVIDAFKKLGNAAKEAGFFRLREPIEVSVPKKEKRL
jgi:hypothetical protein